MRKRMRRRMSYLLLIMSRINSNNPLDLRCICKLWKSLVVDHVFVRNHLSRMLTDFSDVNHKNIVNASFLANCLFWIRRMSYLLLIIVIDNIRWLLIHHRRSNISCGFLTNITFFMSTNFCIVDMALLQFNQGNYTRCADIFLSRIHWCC